MPLGNKSLRIVATNTDRAWQWDGEPVDLVEAVPLFMFEPEPAIIEDDRMGRFAAALSWTISNIVEGFALYAAGMHPEIHHASAGVGGVPGKDSDRRHARQPARLESAMFPGAGASASIRHRAGAQDRIDGMQRQGFAAEHAGGLDGHAPTRPVGSASADWMSSILSILAMPWRRYARALEMHRTRMALQELDDHTLRDIGLSRHDIDAVVRYGRAPY